MRKRELREFEVQPAEEVGNRVQSVRNDVLSVAYCVAYRVGDAAEDAADRVRHAVEHVGNDACDGVDVYKRQASELFRRASELLLTAAVQFSMTCSMRAELLIFVTRYCLMTGAK